MQKQVTLNPGQNQRVSFLVAPSVVGSYGVSLNNLIGSFEVLDGIVEWTEGVIVEKVTVSPVTAYVGEIVNIKVYIQYPDPLPLPVNIHGVVEVNGTLLTGTWAIDYRNPTLVFKYPTTAPGTFTAKAQDKSASFTVIQPVEGTFYSPFGGTRFPICTEVIVPNVPEFSMPGIEHPGGDFMIRGRNIFLVYGGLHRKIRSQLPFAYPKTWSPDGAVVRSYDVYVKIEPVGWVFTLPTNYDCRSYWDSKGELARLLTVSISDSIPDEWKLKYGTTCPTCKGTGTYKPPIGPPRTCHTCGGLRKVWRYDLAKGLRDWAKDYRFYSTCGGGYCVPWIKCPYCDKKIEGPRHKQGLSYDKLSLARDLIEHIESNHPTHSLTAPAWF